LRALPTSVRLGALLAVLATAVAWQYATHPDAALAELSLHALVFAAASWALLFPLGRSMPEPVRAVVTGVALLLPVGFATLVHAEQQAAELARSTWSCLAYGGVLSLPFLGLLKLLDRRAALGLQRALLAGSIAGLAANALLHLHCPDRALAHLLFGHATLGVLAALLALAVAARARRQPVGT
jgi:hypothetical protein